MFKEILGNWGDTVNAKPMAPFDDCVLAFFDDLSKQLTKKREYPDVAAFGFWCRKAALRKEKINYGDLGSRLGRGLVFHSTPSNVAVNFAYSFAAGLLAGNSNIVRMPGRDFEQVSIISDFIRELVSEKHLNLAPYVCFVKYPPDKELHDRFSSICDVRVVWGGDNTINELRQSPMKPRAVELTFADRYSIAVIDADEYLAAADKMGVALAFYNDTYYSDQNACTAPVMVFWLGAEKEKAKGLFWESVRGLARERYGLAPVQSVGKLTALCKAAVDIPALELVVSEDCYVTRVKVTELSDDLMSHKYNSGFYFEHDIDALKDILPVCGERLQTLVYYGIPVGDVKVFIDEFKPRGIDRVVPMGRSMDFSLVWDGYDLIRCMSRVVVV